MILGTVIPFASSTANLLSDPTPAVYISAVLVVAALCQVAAWRLRVPSILPLLVVGFGLGQVATPDDVLGRDVLFAGASLAVGVILFEGALGLSFQRIRGLGRPIRRLCTLTVAIAWPLIALAAWIVGIEPALAVLVGAILVVTGPTVIAPILRMLRPTRRVASMLTWEGIVVDPIGAVLAVLVFQAVLAGQGHAIETMAVNLGKTILVAAVLSGVVGAILAMAMRRHVIPEFLEGPAFLAAAIGCLTASNTVQHESGLLTVTVLGIILGNQRSLDLKHVVAFKENLQVLFVGALFVVLAGRVSPGDLERVLPQAAVLIVVLVLIIRPLSIVIGLWGTDTTRAEKTLLASMAPRGIVAAAVASTFALEFHEAAEQRAEAATAATGQQAIDLTQQATNLADLATGADDLVPIVFLVIVATVTLYGLGIGRLAERLGLASASPQGVLFVGTSPWVIGAAEVFDKEGIPTLVVGADYSALGPARQAGLTVVHANILSDYAVEEMDLAGIDVLVGATDNDEINSTAAREFQGILGSHSVFQLRRADTPTDKEHTRSTAARHLTARPVFQPALTHEEMEQRVASGQLVKMTGLTEEFTLDDFRARYADPVMLFLLDDGEVEVVTESTDIPDFGVSVVALVTPVAS